MVDLVNNPASLDPQVQWDPDSYFVYRNIFDNLVTRDAAGKIVPQVATAWFYQSDTQIVFTLRDDIRFARGLSLRAAVLRHVLRNASIPIVTIAALEVGNLLAGAVIVETVFAWPGIGQLAIQSIAARDFLVVQAIVLFVSTVYIAMNLLADMAYAVIDPRIRLER